MKQQIRLRVEVLEWLNCHHPWSSKGIDYSADESKNQLLSFIIPYEI